MAKLRVLIAAAGRGTRSGLPYPKTLYPIQGTPILLRLLNVLAKFDERPTVVVSPSGLKPISDCLDMASIDAYLVVQPEPRGMGEAVLRFSQSPAYAFTEHVLLAWGDIPFVQRETVEHLVQTHLANNNDFTFATRMVDSAYTVVSRGPEGEVHDVVETREQGMTQPKAGEREMGLFVFRKELTLDLLRENLPGKFGRTTGEHGFLYVIGHLVSRGFCVEALRNATELDLISFNSLADLSKLD